MSDGARVAVEIDAPVELVWEVLTDLEDYPNWNPMTPRVVGELAEGNTLQLTARVGSWMRTQDQEVRELVPGRRLVWSGAFGGELVRGVRTQTVSPLDGGRTLYQSIDVFSGPLARLTDRLYGATLDAGFHAMAEALKETCEARVGHAHEGPRLELDDRMAGQRLPHRASWYVVAWTEDLPVGAVRQATLCGRDLVLWRTRGGRLGAARNVCGHLASRLSPGARVEGERLVCGQHGASFTATGRSCQAHATPLGTIPVREVGPVVMAWYHPEEAPPTFEIPATFLDGWSGWRLRTLDLDVHPQHIMEDLADVRHFSTVHGYRNVRARERLSVSGPVLSFAADVDWDPGIEALPGVPLWFRSTAHGLGFEVTDVHILGDLSHSRHLVMPTPIDAHTTRVRLAVATRVAGRQRRARRAAAGLLNEVFHWAFRRDVLRDASLWTQRLHLPSHAPPGDEAHATFQRWLAQFDAGAQEAAA